MRNLRIFTLCSTALVALVTYPAKAMLLLVWLAAPFSTFILSTNAEEFAKNFYVGESSIHGKGAMASRPIAIGERIGVGIITAASGRPVITSDLGAFLNHQVMPNAAVKYNELSKEWDLVALDAIKAHDEITVDYDHAPWFVQGSDGL